MLAGIEVDDLIEPILVGAALLGDQPLLFETLIRGREVLHIDLDVVAVKIRPVALGLAERQLLLVADPDMDRARLAVVIQTGARPEDLAVEARDAGGRPNRDIELDVGHAEIDRPEPVGVRSMKPEAVAPGTGRLDECGMFA